MTESPSPFAAGAAYIDGRYMPIGDAAIPITDWGYRRSDVTYDVVGVRHGSFFRLDDHVRRFRASMNAFRFNPKESDEDIKAILHRCVALAGLKDAYVAMDCLRGRPPAGMPYHPAYARNYIAAFARALDLAAAARRDGARSAPGRCGDAAYSRRLRRSDGRRTSTGPT